MSLASRRAPAEHSRISGPKNVRGPNQFGCKAQGGSVMTRGSGRQIRALVGVAALAISLYAGAAPKQPRIETGPNAEVTHDGLVRVDRSVVDAAWVKPTLDLTPYK